MLFICHHTKIFKKNYWNLRNSGLNDVMKHSLIINTTYLNINQQYIQKTDMVHFSILYPREQNDLKSLLSVCLSLIWVVSSTFFLGVVDYLYPDYVFITVFSKNTVVNITSQEITIVK